CSAWRKARRNEGPVGAIKERRAEAKPNERFGLGFSLRLLLAGKRKQSRNERSCLGFFLRLLLAVGRDGGI
ncbi:MAG TPA: hypothetical protein VK753_13215, partial [Xanthomonadaceae bacterium]|nr:hypothetical protein [Xanthomonadaceae bacterium]